MENIWAYLKRIFRESEESSPVRPFIHEEIIRGASELQAYEEWKQSLDRHRLLNSLSDEINNLAIFALSYYTKMMY